MAAQRDRRSRTVMIRPAMRLVPESPIEQEPRSWAAAWLEDHALNRPSWPTVWDHSWPWLVVAAMLAYAGCWSGLAMPLGILGVIGALASRRPHR